MKSHGYRIPKEFCLLPIHLHGIISSDEFRDSIDKINRANHSNRVLILLRILMSFTLISRIIFLISGMIITVNDGHEHFYFIPIGILVMAIGGCFSMCLYRKINIQHDRRIRESMKYSSRLPIPYALGDSKL
jgi:hypothetical protein